mmetsp:Transcript_62547/g.141338  ORF Transcript_62547/g.141338 Transcript_62547/m.141338 type:complete len:313 (+) Transcript_62547:399-1337(+)
MEAVGPNRLYAVFALFRIVEALQKGDCGEGLLDLALLRPLLGEVVPVLALGLPELRHGPVGVHLGRVVDQRAELGHGAGHVLERAEQHPGRHDPARLLRTAGGPRENVLGGAHHVDDGEAHLRVLGADPREEHLVPLGVPQGAVHDHVLAALQAFERQDLLDETGLLVGEAAGLILVPAEVAGHLWKAVADHVRVDLHEGREREVALLRHPPHCVALSRAHGPGGEDHPWRLGPLAEHVRLGVPDHREEEVPHNLVLEQLARGTVPLVVSVVQGLPVPNEVPDISTVLREHRRIVIFRAATVVVVFPRKYRD